MTYYSAQSAQSGEHALLTDLYEITMLQAYHLQQMNETAAFEFFVRQLPPVRNFLVAAGLEQVVGYLSSLRFSAADRDWLRASGRFDGRFVDSLRDFRFSGDVDAMPEGTVFFADEPILRITAPLREAQFVESRVINLLHFQTMVASKAIRTVLAARGRQLVDFGMRRAHGAEAALLSARASYLAGFDGTATTLAAVRFGIPVFGTMAHSFIQAHDSEAEAFAAFADAFPEGATLLIDTYDVEAAARKVAALARDLRAQDRTGITAVRLDSGDLAELARRVRAILDDGGCSDIRIFASGNLDEYAVQALVESGAPIDGFGIGTRMNTSSDAPYLDCAYKLVEYDGIPRRKRSTGKETWPGPKQVFRSYGEQGALQADLLTLQGDVQPGTGLLAPVMRSGTVLHELPSLGEIRAYTRAQIAALPADMRALAPGESQSVAASAALQALVREVDVRHTMLARRQIH